MITSKHKVCDFCGEEIGITKRYFTIKSKDIAINCLGTMFDKKNYSMCEDCMLEFSTYLQSKLKGEEE